MKIAKRLFEFYISSSIHVAFAVVSFVFVTEASLQIPISLALYGFVFFGTITSYNFVKYASIAGLHHKSLVTSLKVIQGLSLLCILPLVYLTFQLSSQSLVVLIISGLLTFLYAVPLLFQKNLRAFASLKIIIVAIVWSLVTVMLPVVELGVEVDGDSLLMLLQRFLMVLVLIIPFDIRDVRFDAKGLKTLPQIIGVKKTKIVGVALLLVVMLLEGFKDDIMVSKIGPLTFILCLIAFLVVKSKEEQSGYYASFFVEAVPIIWALGYLLL